MFQLHFLGRRTTNYIAAEVDPTVKTVTFGPDYWDNKHCHVGHKVNVGFQEEVSDGGEWENECEQTMSLFNATFNDWCYNGLPDLDQLHISHNSTSLWRAQRLPGDIWQLFFDEMHQEALFQNYTALPSK